MNSVNQPSLQFSLSDLTFSLFKDLPFHLFTCIENCILHVFEKIFQRAITKNKMATMANFLEHLYLFTCRMFICQSMDQLPSNNVEGVRFTIFFKYVFRYIKINGQTERQTNIENTSQYDTLPTWNPGYTSSRNVNIGLENLRCGFCDGANRERTASTYAFHIPYTPRKSNKNEIRKAAAIHAIDW